MENYKRDVRFFFADAVKTIDTIFRIAGQRYPGLFSGAGKDKSDTYEVRATSVIAQNLVNRWREQYWIANEDVVQMKAIEHMPLLDYFEILNVRHERAKKQKEEHDRLKREERLRNAR